MPEPAPVSPHILVVEVDPGLQLLIQTTLAGMGYASTLASSLEEALRLLHKHPFDLVVTDIFFRNEQKALASLRPLLALSHPLPIILCAAWPFSESVVEQRDSLPR